MCECLEESKHVETLVLRNCGLNDESFSHIEAALEKTDRSDLKVLNLNSNGLSRDSIQKIISIVREKPQLEVLL
jgi:hypothetical protein